VAGILPDDVPGAPRGGKRGAEARGGLVRIVGGMAAGLDALAGAQVASLPVLGLGAQAADPSVPEVVAQGAGLSVPEVGGRARGRVRRGRGLVAGVMLRGTGSRDVRREAAGRVAPGGPVLMGRPAMLGSPVVLGSRVITGGRAGMGRPAVLGSPVVMGGHVLMRHLVMLGSPVITSSPVVMGAGRGSGALGAAHAEAGRQTGLPESGRPGRAKPGTATGPGRTVEQRGDAGRGLGLSGAETVAGKATAALESVHLLRGVAVMAERAARASGRRAAAGLGRRAAAGLGRQAAARAQTGRGGSLVPGATIGTYGGHPAGSA
jgi:hypothetical protein